MARTKRMARGKVVKKAAKKKAAKKKAKAPDKKSVEREIAGFEASEAARNELLTRWLSSDDASLLDPATVADTYKWFLGFQDATRLPEGVDVTKPPKGGKPAPPPAVPSIYGGTLKAVGAGPTEGGDTLPAFTVYAQMRDRVATQRKAVQDSLSPADTAADAAALDKARRLLALIEANGGKLPPGWKGDVAADASGPEASQLPGVVRAAMTGVFAFLGEAAGEAPALCVKPLKVLGDLIAGFEPQGMMGEPVASLDAMEQFFANLCAEDLVAAAALGVDIPEARLVPQALSSQAALATTRGTLSAVLSGVARLLATVGKAAGGTPSIPTPRPVVTLTKVAKGSKAAKAVVPAPDFLGDTFDVADATSAGFVAGVATDGPHVYVALGGGAVAKVGSGFGGSTRGALVATNPDVRPALAAAGSSWDGSSPLWAGVVGTEGAAVLALRDASMKPGTLATFSVEDLSPVGTLAQAGASTPTAAVLRAIGASESKDDGTEAAAKVAASASGSSGGDGTLGASPVAMAVAPGGGLVTLEVAGAGAAFYPVDLPTVEVDSEGRDTPSTRWPLPTAAPCVYRTYAVDAAAGTLTETSTRLLRFPSTLADCTPTTAGTPGWLDAESVGAAPTLGRCPPLTYRGRPQRPVFVASSSNASMWLAEDGRVYFEGAGALYGTASSEAPEAFAPAAGIKMKQVAMSSGCNHALLLDKGGNVYAIGEGDNGEMGNGKDKSSQKLVKVDMAGADKKKKKGKKGRKKKGGEEEEEDAASKTVISVAVATDRSMAVTANGNLMVWGEPATPDHDAELYPTKLTVARKTASVKVAACGNLSAVITSSGALYTLGVKAGLPGLGRGDDASGTPSVVALPHSVADVGVGVGHMAVLTTTGKVFAWGENKFGQVGAAAGGAASTPVAVDLPGPAAGIAVGAHHTLVLLQSGEVLGWGKADDGQLGHARGGGVGTLPLPTPIPGLSAAPAARVFAGDNRSMALPVATLVTGEDLAGATLLPHAPTDSVGVVLPGAAAPALPHTQAGEGAPPAAGAAVAAAGAGGAGVADGPAAVGAVEEAPPAQPTAPYCRVFRLSSGRHSTDTAVEFAGGSGWAPAVADAVNGVVWSAAAGDGKTSLTVYEQEPSPADDAEGATLTGAAFLSNPLFALPKTAGASAPAHVVATSMLASLDALGARLAAGLPDKPDVVAVDAGAGAAGAGGGKAARHGSLRLMGEPEECARLNKSSCIVGWGMSNTDSVVFEVSEDCYLLGLGTMGGNARCTIDLWVCEGNRTDGEEIARTSIDIEEANVLEYFPAMFDEPVLLTAGTKYCHADRAKPGLGSGYYAQNATGAGGAKVELDCGITVNYFPTGGPSNNGTGVTSGRCFTMFVLPTSALATGEEEEDDAVAPAEALPVVAAAPLVSGLDADGLSSALQVVQWGRAALADPSTSGVDRRLAAAATAFTLRLLGRNMADARVKPAPVAPKAVEGEEEEEEEDAAAKAKPQPPPAWVPSDGTLYATTIFDVDTALRGLITSPDAPSFLAAQAQDTFMTLFDTLYPTRALKRAALQALVQAAEGSSGDATRRQQRLLATVMDAVAAGADVVALLTSRDGVDVEDGGGGVEESKSGGGVEESKSDPTPSPSPTPTRVDCEALTPFLSAMQATLLAMHKGEGAPAPPLTPPKLLAMVSNNVQDGVAAFLADQAALGGGGAPPPATSPQTTVTPYAASAVSLLTKLHADAVSALRSASNATDEEGVAGRPSRYGPMETCLRFSSTSNGWGNGGSPDAVSFRVDQDIAIAGICMYGYTPGSGTGEQTVSFKLYEGDGSELLASGNDTMDCDDSTPGEVLFDEPIEISADTMYTVEGIVTSGGTTYYGNGSSTVHTDDGIKWQFSYSSKSSNGTGDSSGQIPCILYQSILPPSVVEEEDAAAPTAAGAAGAAVAAAEGAFVAHASSLLDKAAELLGVVLAANASVAGGDLHPDLAAVLKHDPVFSALLPTLLRDLTKVAAANRNIATAALPQLSALIRTLDAINAPVVAAELAPRAARTALDDLEAKEAEAKEAEAGGEGEAAITVNGRARPSNYRHVVLETEHPYNPASRQKWEVAFPDDVQWVVVEVDPQSGTAQAEDCLTLYGDFELRAQVGARYSGPPRATAGDDDTVWPAGPLVIPGNRVSAVFESATDYANNAEAPKFGVKLTATGHRLPSPTATPLLHLECELAHAAGVCLAQTIDVSTVTSADEDAMEDVAVPSSGGWVPLPAAELDPDCAYGVTLTQDNTYAASSSNGHVTLNYGISAGRMAMEVKIEKETTSQCTCLGAAIREKLMGATGTSYNHPSLWMYRCYNGYTYTRGTPKNEGLRKILQGDTVRVELDMDDRTISYAVNDDEMRVVFRDIDDEGGQVHLAINFYSASRELRLLGVEVAGAAIAQCGLRQAAVTGASEGAIAASVMAEVPPSVRAAVAGGLFEGGLAGDDAEGNTRVSAARQFLNDVAGGEAGTAGGRLADWLAAVVDSEHAVALAARSVVADAWRASAGEAGVKAAADAAAAAGGGGAPTLVAAGATSAPASRTECATCNTVFPSRNKLMKHIMRHGHGVRGGGGGGASSTPATVLPTIITDGAAAMFDASFTQGVAAAGEVAAAAPVAAAAGAGGESPATWEESSDEEMPSWGFNLFGDSDSEESDSPPPPRKVVAKVEAKGKKKVSFAGADFLSEIKAGAAAFAKRSGRTEAVVASTGVAAAVAEAVAAARGSRVVTGAATLAAAAPELGSSGGWEWRVAPGGAPDSTLSDHNRTAVLTAFAAAVWQHGLAADCIAAAAYLRHHPHIGIANVPPEEDLLAFARKVVAEAAAAPADGEESKTDVDALPLPSVAAALAAADATATNAEAMPAVLSSLATMFRAVARLLMLPLAKEQVDKQEEEEEAAAAAAAVAGAGATAAEDSKTMAPMDDVDDVEDGIQVPEPPPADSDESEPDDWHRLVAYSAPSVLCSKCGMYGPSTQTGHRECVDCRLCETCCDKTEACEKANKNNRGRGAMYAEDGYGGFPARGGVVSAVGAAAGGGGVRGGRGGRGKGRRRGGRRGGAAAEAEAKPRRGGRIPKRVERYAEALFTAGAGLPLVMYPKQRLGGVEGAARDFKLPARGGFTATTCNDPGEKRPAIASGVASSVEADGPGLRYFEVEVVASSAALSVGLVPHNKLMYAKALGSGAHTLGYSSAGEATGSGFYNLPPFAAGDVVGCGWGFAPRDKAEDLNYVFFTKNGERVGVPYWGLRSTRTGAEPSFAPAVTAAGAATINANFGQKAFRFPAAEAARVKVLAAGGGMVAGDLSMAASNSSKGMSVAVLERCRLLLLLDPAVPDGPASGAVPPPAPKSTAAPKPEAKAVLEVKPGATRGLDLACAVPAMPKKPPLLRGSTSLGLARMPAPPTLRRAASVPDSVTAGAQLSDGALLSSPSPSLSVGAAHAAQLLDGLFDGATAAGGFVRGIKGVLAFALSAIPGEVVEQAMRQREQSAESRLAGLVTARQLVEDVRTPQALQQVLWFVGTVLLRSSKKSGGEEGDDGTLLGAAKAVAEGGDAEESTIMAGLAGCGAKVKAEVRAAFHALLDTVAQQLIAPAAGRKAPTGDDVDHEAAIAVLPDVATASDEHRMVMLLALRCLRTRLSPADHTFLAASSIFSAVKALMSSDDASPAAVAADGSPAVPTVTALRDLTHHYAANVPSNPDRLHCLTDGTTETFWEPAFGDKGKTSWVMLEFGEASSGEGKARDPVPAGTKPFTVHEVSVHVDVTRDKANVPRYVQLFTGASPDFLGSEAEDGVVVPPKYSGWLTLRPAAGSWPAAPKCLKVALGVTGTNKTRIRGIRVFGVRGEGDGGAAAVPVARVDVKAAALGVFQSLAARVFAGMLSGEGGFGGADEDVAAAAAAGGAAPPPPLLLRRQSSDLRERVAGMLYGMSGSPLKGLQDHLFRLIAGELRRETGRLLASRPWKAPTRGGVTESKADDAEGESKAEEGEATPSWDDTYVFELVCMLLSLSGTDGGRNHVAHPTMVAVLLALLPLASPRVQRQVLSILRRVLPLVDPAAVDAKIAAPAGLLRAALDAKLVAESTSRGGDVPGGDAAAATAAISDESKATYGRGSTTAVLLLAYAKSVTVQVRGRAAGRPVLTTTRLSDDLLPGVVSSDVGGAIRRLLDDLFKGGMEGDHATAWHDDLYAAFRALLLTAPTMLSKTADAPARASHMPHTWAAIAAMAIVGPVSKAADGGEAAGLLTPVEKQESEEEARRRALLSRKRTCENHDDGVTEATVACLACAPAERQETGGKAAEGLTEEEAAATYGLALCGACDVTLHMPRGKREHCRVQIKARVEEALKLEYVGGCARIKLPWLQVSVYEGMGKAMVEFKKEASRGAAGGPICRFCETPLTADNRSPVDPPSPALEHVCSEEECQEKMAASCTKALACGHLCGGVRGEEKCLPCYHGCDGVALEADSFCMICYTEPLGQAPTVQLECGHAFHAECVKALLRARWNGARISFGFMGCPLCKVPMVHPAVMDVVEPLLDLRRVLREKALMRLKYEEKDKAPELTTPGSRFYNDPEGFAEDLFAYYLCFKCKSPYYGGLRACGEAGGTFDPQELICGGCSPWSGELDCPKHGKDFIEFKCRYCCSVAVWFCGGTTHYCEPCHSGACGTTGPCPWVGGKAYDGDKCPLGIDHPPAGEEFPLGCGVCRNAQTF